jgi:hypothetical protein
MTAFATTSSTADLPSRIVNVLGLIEWDSVCAAKVALWAYRIPALPDVVRLD